MNIKVKNFYSFFFSTGGIIGFATTEGTVQRWVLSSHVAAKVRADMEEDLGMRKQISKPKELQKTRMEIDENKVQTCYETIKQWQPIFQSSGAIVSLSSGVNASEDVQKDLLRAETVGKEKSELFINDRIRNNDVDFYDVIPKNQLKTFTTIKKTKVKIKGKDVIIKADRDFFARLTVLQEKRDISTRDLLQYSLGPIAWSLAEEDGNIYKSDKSNLFNTLAEKIETLETIPKKSARIYDGMCIIQQLPSGLETFGELSKTVLNRITSNDSEHIYFVTDQYWKNSIKSCERNRRANRGTIRITASRCNQTLPKQMKKYLGEGENKEELIDFLLNDWKTNKDYKEKLKNR